MYWKWANSVPNRICPSQPVRWLKRNERKRNYQGPFNWALKKPFSSDIMWLEYFNLSFVRALKLCLFLLLFSLSLFIQNEQPPRFLYVSLSLLKKRMKGLKNEHYYLLSQKNNNNCESSSKKRVNMQVIVMASSFRWMKSFFQFFFWSIQFS